MSKSLFFQIVKQILVNLAVHLFYERRFLVNGTSSPRDTQLPFDMLFITMFYTCHAIKEVVYHRGEKSLLRIRKILKLYTVLYRNTLRNIKISLNKIWYTYTTLIPKHMMLSLLNKCNGKKEDPRVHFEKRFAHYEIYTWTICHSYLHKKQTSRIQSIIEELGSIFQKRHIIYHNRLT